MFAEVTKYAVDHAFEIMSLFVAIVALAVARLALKVALQANQIAKETHTSALRVRLRDEVSAAKRSLVALEEACRQIRNQWEQHWAKHLPIFGRPNLHFFDQPQETRHISENERAGRALFQELSKATGMPVSNDTAELERRIVLAQQTSLDIEQLIHRLEGPKPLGR